MVITSLKANLNAGNTVYMNTADGNGLPWLQLPKSGRFGPANGTWH